MKILWFKLKFKIKIQDQKNQFFPSMLLGISLLE